MLNLDTHLLPSLDFITLNLERFEIKLSNFIIYHILTIHSESDGAIIKIPNGRSIELVTGCTGLKQIIQLSIILIFIPGPGKKKIWYIPLSAIILFLAAIIHFLILTVTLYKAPDFFTFFHDHVSRWFFFLVFFLVWVYWEEKIRKLKSKANNL